MHFSHPPLLVRDPRFSYLRATFSSRSFLDLWEDRRGSVILVVRIFRWQINVLNGNGSPNDDIKEIYNPIQIIIYNSKTQL